jgi:hypothetical protein
MGYDGSFRRDESPFFVGPPRCNAIDEDSDMSSLNSTRGRLVAVDLQDMFSSRFFM